MNTPDSNDYQCRLVFCLQDNSDKNEIKQWRKLKKHFNSIDHINSIVKQIRDYCQLESNKNLPILRRVEGGLGGDDNNIHKQIRFSNRDVLDEYIVMDIYNTDFEKWTYKELDDLIYAFKKLADDSLDGRCVESYIEIKNYKFLDDSFCVSD
jgi:hypothetical protein